MEKDGIKETEVLYSNKIHINMCTMLGKKSNAGLEKHPVGKISGKLFR